MRLTTSVSFALFSLTLASPLIPPKNIHSLIATAAEIQGKRRIGDVQVYNACPFDIDSTIIHTVGDGSTEEIHRVLKANQTVPWFGGMPFFNAHHSFHLDDGTGVIWEFSRADGSGPVQMEWTWSPVDKMVYWDLSMVNAMTEGTNTVPEEPQITTAPKLANHTKATDHQAVPRDEHHPQGDRKGKHGPFTDKIIGFPPVLILAPPPAKRDTGDDTAPKTGVSPSVSVPSPTGNPEMYLLPMKEYTIPEDVAVATPTKPTESRIKGGLYRAGPPYRPWVWWRHPESSAAITETDTTTTSPKTTGGSPRKPGYGPGLVIPKNAPRWHGPPGPRHPDGPTMTSVSSAASSTGTGTGMSSSSNGTTVGMHHAFYPHGISIIPSYRGERVTKLRTGDKWIGNCAPLVCPEGEPTCEQASSASDSGKLRSCVEEIQLRVVLCDRSPL